MGIRALIAALVPALALVSAASCSFPEMHVSGELSADGAPFAVAGCRSGSPGYAGVEISGAQGQRIRLLEGVDGHGTVIVFPPGAHEGTTLPACAEVSVHGTGYTINGVKMLEGQARLACRDLRGAISFRCAN